MREDLKFLIVGDTIIDEDIFLIASGISLETPTLKTTYDTNKVKYGGAANVARQLADYDLDVTFLTSVSKEHINPCLLYTSPSPRDRQKSRMPSSA